MGRAGPPVGSAPPPPPPPPSLSPLLAIRPQLYSRCAPLPNTRLATLARPALCLSRHATQPIQPPLPLPLTAPGCCGCCEWPALPTAVSAPPLPSPSSCDVAADIQTVRPLPDTRLATLARPALHPTHRATRPLQPPLPLPLTAARARGSRVAARGTTLGWRVCSRVCLGERRRMLPRLAAGGAGAGPSAAAPAQHRTPARTFPRTSTPLHASTTPHAWMRTPAPPPLCRLLIPQPARCVPCPRRRPGDGGVDENDERSWERVADWAGPGAGSTGACRTYKARARPPCCMPACSRPPLVSTVHPALRARSAACMPACSRIHAPRARLSPLPPTSPQCPSFPPSVP